MPPLIIASATMQVNLFWVTMPPVTIHPTDFTIHRLSKHSELHARDTGYTNGNGIGRILTKEREKRYSHQPGRRRAVYNELETTQTTFIKRIPAINRYRIFPNASASSSSSSFNKIRNTSWRFTSGVRSSGGNKEDVNLMIIPFGALFLFIIVCLLYVSRWCIEDIREADRAIVTVTSCDKRKSDETMHDVTNQSMYHRRNESSDENGGFVFGQSVTNYTRSMAASQLNVGPRRTRNIRIAPARSTRSLNGLRAHSSGERLTRSAIRRINNAGSSSSSIPLNDLSSTSTLLLGSRRTIEHDEIVESCRRAVGNLLQNHIVVVPIDMTGYPGQFTGGNRPGNHSTRIRTRNNSSPAAATFSTAPAHRTAGGIANEHSPVGGSNEASRTGSYCSDTRPLLGRFSSSSDGRIQLPGERMTSSDSNIDAKTGSPVASRRRLHAIDNKRRGIITGGGASGAVNKKALGVMHQPSGGSRPQQRRCHAYQHQSSVPAVSKLVYDSLNLSFRFFQVPAVVERSYSSSGKESLDSVFMAGGLIAPDEVHSSSVGSSPSRRATHPTVERVSPCSGAQLPVYSDQPADIQQIKSTASVTDTDSQNKINAVELISHDGSCEEEGEVEGEGEASEELQVVIVHRGAEMGGSDARGTGEGNLTVGGSRCFPPPHASIDRRSSSTAESAIYSASVSADTLPGGAADSTVVHSRLSESDRITSSPSSLMGGRAPSPPTRRSMSSSELHPVHRVQDEQASEVVTGE